MLLEAPCVPPASCSELHLRNYYDAPTFYDGGCYGRDRDDRMLDSKIEIASSPGVMGLSSMASPFKPRLSLAETTSFDSPLAPNSWPRPDAGTAAAKENSRLEKPLDLLHQYSSAASGVWRPLAIDEDRRVFSFVWPAALDSEQAHQYHERLLESAPWTELRNSKNTSTTRLTCWYSRGGCTCDYSYGRDVRMESSNVNDGCCDTESKETAPNQFLEVMRDLTEHIFGQLFPGLGEEAWPNSANLNLYRDGRQGVGWHADDESLFRGWDNDCPIVSLSLGATREFWLGLRRNGVESTEPDTKSIAEVDLNAGDIITMEGLCQRHCLHFVPKVNPRQPMRDERINITFRWVRSHRNYCPRRQAPKSSLPAALRGIFGEVRRKNDKGKGKGNVVAARLFPRPYIRSWSLELMNGVLANPGHVEWKLCDGCQHKCFEEGRPCCEGSGEWSGLWFCRKCWLQFEPDSVAHSLPLGPMVDLSPQPQTHYQMPDFQMGNPNFAFEAALAAQAAQAAAFAAAAAAWWTTATESRAEELLSTPNLDLLDWTALGNTDDVSFIATAHADEQLQTKISTWHESPFTSTRLNEDLDSDDQSESLIPSTEDCTVPPPPIDPPIGGPRTTSLQSIPSDPSIIGSEIWERPPPPPPSMPPPPPPSDLAPIADTSIVSQGTKEEPIGEHMLPHQWHLWFLLQWEAEEAERWEDAQRCIHGPIASVEEIWRLVRHIHPPSALNDADYSVFCDGVTPAREHPSVRNGGRWIVAIATGGKGRSQVQESCFDKVLDQAFLALMLAILGGGLLHQTGLALNDSSEEESMNDSLCVGLVVSVRSPIAKMPQPSADSKTRAAKIAVWIASAHDEPRVRAVGHALRRVLASSVPEGDAPRSGWHLAFEEFRQQAVTLRI